MSESISSETKKFFQPATEFPEHDPVNHPKHYRPLPGIDFECIDVTRHLTFNVGNATKYVWRADAKNGRQDLEKATWYLRDAIENNPKIFTARFGDWQTINKLHAVARAQTDHNRFDFFEAIGRFQLDLALEAVTAMLAED